MTLPNQTSSTYPPNLNKPDAKYVFANYKSTIKA